MPVVVVAASGDPTAVCFADAGRRRRACGRLRRPIMPGDARSHTVAGDSSGIDAFFPLRLV
jgi:hypothetical protein